MGSAAEVTTAAIYTNDGQNVLCLVSRLDDCLDSSTILP